MLKARLILQLCSVFLILFAWPAIAQQTQSLVSRGVADLSSYDFSNGSIALDGEWNFYDSKLLSAKECSQAGKSLVKFPQLWNKLRKDKNGKGYGTYYIKLILPTTLKRPGFSLPQLYCSYSLWIDSTLVAKNGVVGKTKEESKPQWLPQVVSFPNPGDTLHLVLQVSNFDHNLGGINDSIILGEYSTLSARDRLARMCTQIEIGVLLVLFITCIIIVSIQKGTKRIIFYFGLVCLSWSLRASFSNLYEVTSYFPDFNWWLAVKIEYITLFFTMIWGILFIGRLFPNEENKIIKYLLVTGNSFFIAFAILTAPLIFTKGVDLYLAFCGILLAYGIYVVIKALINERIGVWYLVASSLLAIAIFALDVSAYKGVVENRPVMFSIGYIVMYILMMIALLLHLKIFKSSKVSNMLTYEDLYGDTEKNQ